MIRRVSLRYFFFSSGGNFLKSKFSSPPPFSLTGSLVGLYQGIPSTFMGTIVLPSSSKGIFSFLGLFLRFTLSFSRIQVAFYIMSVAELYRWRRFPFTNFHTLSATGVEFTTRRRIGWRRNRTFENNPIHFIGGIGYGYRAEQRLRIRMLRIREKFVRFSVFHQISKIHNADGI